jgi:cardiolipin synthase
MSSNRKINTSYTFHNRVNLVKGGEMYFKTMSEMITKAQSFIQLQVYIFEADHTGKKIAQQLIDAASNGVNVQVLLDGYASRNLSVDLISDMRAAGIRLRFFEPIFKSSQFYFGRRLHHKILVCDGISALVGGINISDRYNDMPGAPGWLDWAVKVDGEAALELQKVCNRMFARKDNEWNLLVTGEKNVPLWGEMHCPVRIRRNDWVKNLNQVSATYMKMLRNAKAEIIIMSSYFIPSSFFRRQMAQALKRGVKIRLILAGRSDVGIAKYAERFLYQWALRNNVEIFEYKHNILHGKMAVCDRNWVTLGSYNINDISAKASIELNIDIEDAGFAESTLETLNQIILQGCEKVIKNEHKKGIPERLAQWFAYEIYKSMITLFTFYFKKEKK